LSGDPFAPGDSLFYDAAGNPTRWKNLTDGSNDSLFWDAENRLTRHKRRASGGSLTFDVQYSYDGFGRRVRRIAGSSDTLYVWDGWHLLAATSNTGTALRKYTYFPGTLDFPLAMRVGSTTTYLRLDGQGNVYQTRTTGGSVQAEYRYRAWGDRYNAATETVASPFTYKAREEDRTTGLVYMRHRYYSPRLERFVNEDPIGTAGGLNVYGFGALSPVNFSDPMGMGPCETWSDAVGYWALVVSTNGEGAEMERVWEWTWCHGNLARSAYGAMSDYFREATFPYGSGFGAYDAPGRGLRYGDPLPEATGTSCSAASTGLDIAAAFTFDGLLLAAYWSGASLLARGGLMMLEGWAMGNGLILTATANGGGATGVMVSATGQATARVGAAQVGATASSVFAGPSMFPGVNSFRALRRAADCQ
jgi:RHS repeat-associated protein